MKCFTHQLAFAAAVATAIMYIIGTLLVLLFPHQILHIWAPLYYMKTLDPIAPYMGISLLGFASGIVQSFIYTYGYAWLLGSIYNQLLPQ